MNLYKTNGFAALSMRSVAKALGVAPNALYSHVRDKDEIVDRLIDRLLIDVAIPATDMEWRDALTELMSSSRRLLVQHADLMPVFLSRPSRGPNALRLADSTLSILARGGVRGDRAVTALRLLLVFTLGFAAQETPRLHDTDSERVLMTKQAYDNSGRPALREVSDALSQHPNEHAFNVGLKWLIDGIDKQPTRLSSEAE